MSGTAGGTLDAALAVLLLALAIALTAVCAFGLGFALWRVLA